MNRRMSSADYRAMLEKKKGGNKFKAERAEGQGGRSFHSKLERTVDQILLMRVKAGEIVIERRQDPVTFVVNGIKILTYIVDFRCRDLRADAVFYVEAKGFRDALWTVKEALWRALGPGPLEMWCGDHGSPRLTEIIIPEETCK